MKNLRINALALFLGVDVEDLKVCSDNSDIIEHGSSEYLVVTDSEADNYWDEYLELYIDECILSEIPSIYRGYFDSEGWKADARLDGRGHSLATYDGQENEINVYCWKNMIEEDIYTNDNVAPEGFWSSGEI